ncbi:hypothetical protein FA15DRAFT_452882 [Coprinopsis marcescibilis]|uniref:Uncharacterized protein n=1 Tax=Coprinopsis marcescibilis TaxID=230819 RepID=A0A5C3K922_COPMA|nr:hypothetical protein FA15DRAFT_452882 [Coprinopsis marcescibilis]
MSNHFSYLGSTWADSALAFCTAGSLLFFYKKQMEILNFAMKEGGEVKARPTTLLSRIITPIHFIGMLFMPVVFLIAYATRSAIGIKNDIVGGWLREYSLPTVDFTPQTVLALQIVGVISSVWVWKATCDVFTFLGSQWHFIGVRPFCFADSKNKA